MTNPWVSVSNKKICYGRGKRTRTYHVAHEHEGLVAQDDPARLRDRLQTRGEIGLGADDRVIHPVVAAEIADVAEAGVDAHPHAEGLFDAALSPLHVELGEA